MSNYLTRQKDPTLKPLTVAIVVIWAITLTVITLPVTKHKPVINPIGGEKQYYPVNGVMRGSNYLWGRIR